MLPRSNSRQRGRTGFTEIKHDGYRCQVLVERGKARVFTRNGYDWSDRYPSIVRAAANLRCGLAIIDGEAIVQNGEGAADFKALRSAIRREPHNIILYAFDLLHLDGRDLRQQTLTERRTQLENLILLERVPRGRETVHLSEKPVSLITGKRRSGITQARAIVVGWSALGARVFRSRSFDFYEGDEGRDRFVFPNGMGEFEVDSRINLS